MRLIREEKAFIREAVLLMLPMILQNFVTFPCPWPTRS